MAVNEQFPTLMPTLYLGSKATDSRPFASLNAMLRALSYLAHNETPAVNGEKRFHLLVSSTGARSSAPLGPRPADHGRGQDRVPSQSLSLQTGSSHHPIVMPIDASSHPWLDHASNCWPLKEHHCAEVFAVSGSFKTDYPPLWSGLISPSTHADALRENRGLCLNCHEDNHSFKHRRHPFINASGCLNPELGQLGDDDAYRRWQARMVCYRREGKSSRPNNHKKNCRRHSGQSRGYHQDQDQVENVTTITHTRRTIMMVSRPRPPLLPPLLLLECALEPPVTRAEILTRASLAHSVPAIDSSTAVRHTRPVRRQHCRGHLFWFQKVLVCLLLACPITQHKFPLPRAHGLLRRLLTILTA